MKTVCLNIIVIFKFFEQTFPKINNEGIVKNSNVLKVDLTTRTFDFQIS